MTEQSPLTTFLFTDIEGSTRLWEQEPERMRLALAGHDGIAQRAVAARRGRVVKTTGDGIYAVFADPLDAIAATVDLHRGLADANATNGIALRVRCGLHIGVVESRDEDFFGGPVNRTARIMGAGHGGQVLLSQAVADLVRDRLPAGLSLVDLGTVRLRDLRNAEHLYQLAHPDLRRDFPALRSLESTPNNLPLQLTSFVGRAQEIEDIAALLSDARLVTLLGAGGIGKTRLALQVGAAQLDTHPDGVWLVELAALADARLVVNAVASTLGVKEEPGHGIEEAVLEFVRDRRLLLVLDNCEHLVQACADIARRVLQASPTVKVLATSRERLHLTGEVVYPLQPLAFPMALDPATPSTLMANDAVQLFVERAASAQRGFKVTDQNADAVAEVCRRLDGIPLALELAAARVRSLSVQQIASRLNDRFRLLTNGDRTALPRQQTLRALIDWSYELLTEPERVFLSRLAVFAGGWTIEAAEAVTEDARLAEFAALDLLTMLVEKSLAMPDVGGERYRLLETVQRYAEERLTASGEADAVHARHFDHYLALAESAHAELNGPDQATWLKRLDADRENLLAAHGWCDRAADGAERGLRLVTATRRYWIFRGLLDLGWRVAAAALARPGAQTRSLARCRALFDIGQIGSWMGRYAESRCYLEESLSIAREIGDKRSIEVALQPLAMACLGQGNAGEAREHLVEALALARELGEQREIAGVLNALAQLHREQGEFEAAEPLLRDVIATARAIDDRQIIAVGLLNLAMTLIGQGATGETRTILLEALRLSDETGSKPTAQSALEVCAGLAAHAGDYARAARLYGATQAQAGETGLRRDPADDAFLTPLIDRTRAELTADAFDHAEADGKQLAYDAALAEAQAWLRQ
ncbi:MAG: tetratricopeptide repeat protein [Casimicrobiaceae bacterium]